MYLIILNRIKLVSYCKKMACHSSTIQLHHSVVKINQHEGLKWLLWHKTEHVCLSYQWLSARDDWNFPWTATTDRKQRGNSRINTAHQWLPSCHEHSQYHNHKAIFQRKKLIWSNPHEFYRLTLVGLSLCVNKNQNGRC